MTPHPNDAVLRNALAAFSSGDPTLLQTAFASTVIWRVPGRSPLAGVYRGQPAVFGFFATLQRETNHSFRVQPLSQFANDEGGIFVDRLTANRGAKALDIELVLRVRISNGQIVEGIDHFHQEHLWDAFWA